MPRDGVIVLSDVREPSLTIVCEPCGRHGLYDIVRVRQEALACMSILPSQCRAARALVDKDQAELARRAVVPRDMIGDFERGSRAPPADDLAAIRAALEAAGVIFVDENGEGPGVRLRKKRER